jgi:hypothetical protein
LVIFIPTIVCCFIGMECYSMWWDEKTHFMLDWTLAWSYDEISFAFFQRLFIDGNNSKSHIFAWCNSRFKEQKRMLLNTLTFLKDRSQSYK